MITGLLRLSEITGCGMIDAGTAKGVNGQDADTQLKNQKSLENLTGSLWVSDMQVSSQYSLSG